MSAKTPWHHGPTLLAHLESIDIESDVAAKPFRFPVQWVNRPDADFRGFSGTVASGLLRVGAEVVVLPTGTASRVARIVTADGDRDEAAAGDAITLTLTDDIDVSRGDIIVLRNAPAEVSDQFAAHILWMCAEPLLAGRSYLMRAGDKWTAVSITAIKHKLDVHTLDHIAAREVALNEIAVCNIATSMPIAFDTYAESRATGAFILVDRYTNDTVAAGMIEFGLRRATNLRWEKLAVDREARAALKHQRPCILCPSSEILRH